MPVSIGRRDDFTAFTDLLFNILVGFAFMFFIALLMINPVADKGKIDSKAEFLITVTWAENDASDVDTYVQDPAGNLVWFKTTSIGLMHLDRDDTGMINDTIKVDGVTVINPLNQETVSIRGILPGEYVVNVHQYRAAGYVPVPVKIRVEKLNPKVTLVFYGSVSLDYTGQERTAVRFTVSGDGSVSGVSTLEKPLATAAHRRAHDMGGARPWQAALASADSAGANR